MEILEFKDLPGTDTPINSNNLNKVQQNVKDVFDGNVAMGSIVVDDIKCRQLFDKYDVIDNYYLGYENGEPTWDGNMAYMKSYIEVEQNTKYTMCNDTPTIFIIHRYDSNKNFLGYLVQNDTNNFYTSSFGNDTKYVRLSCGKAQKDTIMFVKGSVIPDKYIEYKNFNNTINIVTGEETPTNECEDGKRVYVKKIDCGSLPNNGYKDISTGLSATNVTVKKWEVTQYRTSDGFVAPIPFAYYTEIVGCYLYTKSTNNDIRLKFHSNNDRSSYTATARIYYTKNK